LSYLKNPDSTIKYNNPHRDIISPARAAYRQQAHLQKAFFEVIDLGLGSTITKTLGVTLAAQIRRYFIEKAAGLDSSLPHSPIRHGFIFLSENDLWPHLYRSPAIRHFLRASTSEDPEFLDLQAKKPGWLLTRLVTKVGDSMQDPVRQSGGGYSRTTTIATTIELNTLRNNIKGGQAGAVSSSQILMDFQPAVDTQIQQPAPNQPVNVLPSFLLRGMIVTNGRTLYLSAVDLRKRARQRFVTELRVDPNDGMLRRHHVLAPDRWRLLPSISKAIPDPESLSDLFPDTTKVDVGALDLGKEFMVGFACRRYDRPGFVYTTKSKSKAVYQPTNKAQRERERAKESATITRQAPFPQARQLEQTVSFYESSLSSFGNNAINRISQERQPEYRQYDSFFNKHGRHQKTEAQAKRARRSEFDVLTSHILTAMGTHTARSQDPSRRGLILVGTGGFSALSKGHQMSLHNSFLSHFLPRVS
jgi:hypothetical protein